MKLDWSTRLKMPIGTCGEHGAVGKADRILGGVFGLESPVFPGRTLFSGLNAEFFLSVRCALYALVHVHRPGSAWLPSYLCGAILAPFLKSGVPVRFYPIDRDLRVSDTSWLNEIRAGDLAVVIHYFGFPNRSFPAEQVKRAGALLVEDASQALFLPRQFRESTCVLYSPRKFLGVPDSGVMVSTGETGAESVPLDEPPLAWWRQAVAMSLARRDFDLTGGPNDWFARFQRVESEFPIGLYRASDLSRMLVAAVDYEAIRTRRRASYGRLLDGVGRHALFPELGPEVVPLGFPVRVEAGIRDSVLRRLHAAKVYAAMHWPIDGIVPASFHQSHGLALSSLTLLCDQRCTEQDMDRQASEFEASVSAARASSRETPSTASNPIPGTPARPD
jgi:hypothetical protein